MTPTNQFTTKEFMAGVVKLYPDRPDLYPFNNFGPSVLKDGDTWNEDIVSTAMGAAQVSPMSTVPTQVQPRPVGKLTARAERVAEYHAWDQREKQTLRAPGKDALVTQRELVASTVEGLLQRWFVLKSLRWSQVLQARQIVVSGVNNLTYTVDYSNLIGLIGNPTTLGEAGLAWSNAGASIVRDIAAMKRAFRALYGVYPTHVKCNPDIEQYFLKNTEFIGWVKSEFGRSVRDFLSGPAATPGALGWNFLNLQWEFVGQKYLSDDSDPSSMTDYWGTNVLSLRYQAQGERVFEFWQAKTDETDMKGGPITEPWQDPAIKGKTGVVLYGNGLPVVRMPNRVATVLNIAA